MSKPIKIGVFIPNGSQTLDLATVDILGVMSKEYISVLPMPSRLRDAAPSVTVYYITSPSIYPDVPLTSNAVLKASHTHRDADVAPGKLDIVVVPGPDPSSTYEKEGLEWLRRQAETPGVDILSVCTGILVCASAGIVDGKLASGPRGMQSDLMKKFPKIKLVGDSQRWVQDGNFWSSGGVTNGNDLMAAYARASGRWPASIVDTGLMLTDVEPRPQFYEIGQSRFFLNAAWMIVRAWFASFGSATKQKPA
ncbi:hypothetical protein V2G26_014605 [Clonostachys chloroleuca]